MDRETLGCQKLCETEQDGNTERKVTDVKPDRQTDERQRQTEGLKLLTDEG